ncbi:MAG: tetratricopeptide repeat protein [Gammaproteobacteria bacterium]|nr:tetratricopeptide repeat protein [Gammaproteobacteria bacterium]NNL46693.1 tetratricopeptide repeat protein [Woeseiaceae bacterium]
MTLSIQKLLVLFVVATIFLPLPGATAADYSQALELLRRQDYARAEPLLREVLARKADAEADYLLGFLLIETYRFEEAEQHLLRAVAARPLEDHWLMVLAKSQLEQGKNINAGKTLQQAINLDPLPGYYHAHAMTALNTGDFDAAEASLRACIQEDPEHNDALYRLGGLLIDKGRGEDGIAFLERARTLNPDNVDTLYELGAAYRHAGRRNEAEKILYAVVARVPGHVGALHNLARVLIQSAKYEAAEEVQEKFRAMSKLRDEIDFNEQAVRKNPDNIDGRLHLATLLLRAGRTQDALSALLAARVLAPRDARVYRTLATAYRGLGDENNAERAERFATMIGG